MTGRGKRVPPHEVELQITCGLPGQPNHGEQLLIWAAIDLTDPDKGIYLKGKTVDAWRWHGVKGENGFLYPADYSAKVDPRCKRCITRLRITAETLTRYLEAMRRQSGDKPWRLRLEYRELDGLVLK